MTYFTVLEVWSFLQVGVAVFQEGSGCGCGWVFLDENSVGERDQSLCRNLSTLENQTAASIKNAAGGRIKDRPPKSLARCGLLPRPMWAGL